MRARGLLAPPTRVALYDQNLETHFGTLPASSERPGVRWLPPNSGSCGLAHRSNNGRRDRPDDNRAKIRLGFRSLMRLGAVAALPMSISRVIDPRPPSTFAKSQNSTTVRRAPRPSPSSSQSPLETLRANAGGVKKRPTTASRSRLIERAWGPPRVASLRRVHRLEPPSSALAHVSVRRWRAR